MTDGLSDDCPKEEGTDADPPVDPLAPQLDAPVTTDSCCCCWAPPPDDQSLSTQQHVVSRACVEKGSNTQHSIKQRGDERNKKKRERKRTSLDCVFYFTGTLNCDTHTHTKQDVSPTHKGHWNSTLRDPRDGPRATGRNWYRTRPSSSGG